MHSGDAFNWCLEPCVLWHGFNVIFDTEEQLQSILIPSNLAAAPQHHCKSGMIGYSSEERRGERKGGDEKRGGEKKEERRAEEKWEEGGGEKTGERRGEQRRGEKRGEEEQRRGWQERGGEEWKRRGEGGGEWKKGENTNLSNEIPCATALPLHCLPVA